MSHRIRDTHRAAPPEALSSPNGSVVGIDISKNYFDAFFEGQHHRYAYSLEGIETFMSQTASLGEACFVMEATGNYFYKLALALVEAGRKTYVVNAYRVRAFGKSRLQRHKSDKADARLIDDFALANREAMVPWQPESQTIAALRQLRTVRAQLQKTATVYKNQRHALLQLPERQQSQDALQACQQMIAYCQKQLKAMGKQMEALLDDELKKNYALLDTIAGIGRESALMLLILTGNFTKFRSAKAFADYIGIAPTHYESGTSVKGRGSISKMGDARARQVLYLAAMSAVRYNEACRAFYVRLRQTGHVHRHAVVAVANKLIRQAFAVIRQQAPFETRGAWSVSTRNST